MTAVKQNGLSLEHVKTQTPEVCLAAVKQNYWALDTVQNPNIVICLAAIERDLASNL